MNSEEKRVWKSLENFEIDDPESSFTFTDRLCRENGWTMEFSLRAVLEYKKFLFLICISNKSQTPSDEVDQVWHLHLLYTNSYWIELCKNTINKKIHHGPTKGMEERGVFSEQYDATLELYKLKFSQLPPADIWPHSKIRFSSVNFMRVNRHINWVIPKIKFKN